PRQCTGPRAWEAAAVGEARPHVRKSEDLPTAARSTPRGAGRGSPEGGGLVKHGPPQPRCVAAIATLPPHPAFRTGSESFEGGTRRASRNGGCAMTSQDTSSPVATPADPVVAAARAARAIDPNDHVPLPPAASGSAHPPEAEATTWITKEAGNRRLAFDPARLERSIDVIAAGFPQLEIGDYKRAVLGFV